MMNNERGHHTGHCLQCLVQKDKNPEGCAGVALFSITILIVKFSIVFDLEG